jgi:hypothetical protein
MSTLSSTRAMNVLPLVSIGDNKKATTVILVFQYAVHSREGQTRRGTL